MKKFKIVSVCVLFLIFCSSTNAFWTRHKKPLEQEFNELLKQYPVTKKNYEDISRSTKNYAASLRKLRRTQTIEEKLDNNPEIENRYDHWGQINNLFVRMNRPQNKYEGALKRANEAIRDMINALNEVSEMESQYYHLLKEKHDILKSL